VNAYSPPFRTWDSEAWKVVVASDTGSHMGPERLIAWSAPYRMLPGLNEEDQREARLVRELRDDVPASDDPSPEDIRSLRLAAGQLRLSNRRFNNTSQLFLVRIAALGAQVPEPIQHELIADARNMYGNCITIPDLEAKPAAGRMDANLSSPLMKD
jgi:hypothetical protein